MGTKARRRYQGGDTSRRIPWEQPLNLETQTARCTRYWRSCASLRTVTAGNTCGVQADDATSRNQILQPGSFHTDGTQQCDREVER